MKTTLLVVTLFVLAGCASQVPIPTGQPISYQAKVKATHHWDLIAEDVAIELAKSLQTDDALKTHGIFVTPTVSRIAFNTAFQNFLITRMVNKGLPVAKWSTGVEVKYETQLVTHGSDRIAYQPGTLTLLAGGLMVARNVALNLSGDTQALATLAIAGLGDAAISYTTGPATKTELIVTTSLTYNNRFVMRKTDVYYIEDADVQLFMERQAPPGTPVRDWKTIGGS